VKRKKEDWAKRFLGHIDFGQECWLWTSTKGRGGYGQFALQSRAKLAHRVSYNLFKGWIPEDLEIDHICNVRSCVNPDHLRAVTGRFNTLRGNCVSAVNARKTHCIHGHKFSPDNIYTKPGAPPYYRACRKCLGVSSRRQYLKKIGGFPLMRDR